MGARVFDLHLAGDNGSTPSSDVLIRIPHDGPLYGMTWSPDGQTLITGGTQLLPLINPIERRLLDEHTRELLTRELTPAECRRYDICE